MIRKKSDILSRVEQYKASMENRMNSIKAIDIDDDRPSSLSIVPIKYMSESDRKSLEKQRLRIAHLMYNDIVVSK